jgi:hypothetical protein
VGPDAVDRLFSVFTSAIIVARTGATFACIILFAERSLLKERAFAADAWNANTTAVDACEAYATAPECAVVIPNGYGTSGVNVGGVHEYSFVSRFI